MLTSELDKAKERTIQFAAHVEMMKDHSIRGLISRDEHILLDVIKTHEPQANQYELDLEETCVQLIAMYQPMAKDLRTILVLSNMSNALERIGDHAVNIAESALEIITRPPVKPFIDIPRMNDITKKMLDDTIHAFIREDPQLARLVCEQDDLVDNLHDQIFRELVTYMTENPGKINDCIHILRIAENLERIGDMATNVCEDVIFAAEGTVIKHHKGEGQSTDNGKAHSNY